jgi:hypothetical protein
MHHNGTAIKGGCVTGEANRPTDPIARNERIPADKTPSRLAGQFGAIFEPAQRLLQKVVQSGKNAKVA